MLNHIFLAALIGVTAASSMDKVCHNLKAKTSTADIAVSFTAGTEPIFNRINAARYATRGLKITAMKEMLKDLQASSQRNAIAVLDSQSIKIKYQSFWINNRIYISDATPEIIASLAALPEVAEIREELKVSLITPIPSSNLTVKAEWGVDKIQAPDAWNMFGGATGSGIIVSAIDTGARYTHQDLKNNWRSSYGWHDVYGSQLPRDGNGHGTHVTGTIAGANGIGVAPGAQWISCKGIADDGSGTERNLIECGEWIMCPYNETGEDCNQAPNVCSNSWGVGGGIPFYDTVIYGWRTAGIIPVFASGNDYFCRTVGSPADNPYVIAVGATNKNDGIALFSSKGPPMEDDDLIKPQVSAPGTEIVSAGNGSDTARETLSGTSMAAPHVAGAIALLLSKNPSLTYQQITDLLQDNAERNVRFSLLPCGAIPWNRWPNHIYGHGRINVKRALEAVTVED